MSGRTQPWGTRMSFPDPAPEACWSARRALAFITASSTALWITIVAVGQILLPL